MVTILGPAIILAIWGGAYAWSCVLALSAPGKPIQFTYKSPGGPIELRASSYAVDWNRHSGFVTNLRVFGPSGVQIASAGQVYVTGLGLRSPGSIQAHVRDVSATIVRLKSGQFEFQGFLPPRKGPPSQLPFLVDVDRAELTILDESGAKPFRQAVRASDIEIRGVGDRWMANASIRLPDKGDLRARLVNIPDSGLLIRAETSGLRIAELLRHELATPDLKDAPWLKDLSARSLQVQGPISLFIPEKSGLQIVAQMSAKGDGVTYGAYQADQATFSGIVSEAGARGTLTARRGSVRATFDGSIDWQDGAVLGGKLVATTASREDLPPWLREMIPDDIRFTRAHTDGWLDYRDGVGMRVQGAVQAQQATIFGEPIAEPSVQLAASSRQVRVGIRSGTWAGSPVQGAVSIGLRPKSLTGAISASKVNLASLARRFGARGLSGTADASVLIGGTPAKPTAVLQARGSGRYPFNGRALNGRFQAAGALAENELRVDRFRIGTDAGSLRALGTISLKDRRLALKVDAPSIQLERLRDDLAGTISASGVLKGTMANPQFRGQALAFGLQVKNQEAPFASADIAADKSSVSATNLHIVKGSGEATGAVAVNLKTHGLSGALTAKNVLLNEYLGDDALGVVTIPNVTLGGTWEKPRAAGTAFGADLVMGGIHVDRIDVVASLLGATATIDRLNATIGDGTIAASGKYDVDAKSGSAELTASAVALSRITPPGKGAADITGTLDGHAHATLSPSGTWRGSANGSLREVALNGTQFGSGNWGLAYDGVDLTGNASVGKLDRFLLLENVDLNTSSKTIQAQVSVLNGSLQDLYTSVVPFFPELSYDVRSRLDTAVGNLDATITFSGALSNPDFAVKYLEARDLGLQGMPLGTLDAELSKVGSVWNAQKFNWAGPQGTLLLGEAHIDREGSLSVDGDLINFNLAYLGLIDPNWAQLTGTASVSFLASGASDSPEIRASLESTKGTAFAIGATGESFSINLDTIRIRQAQYSSDGAYDGGINASGKFYYRGFTGDVSAHIPFNFPAEVPDGRAITATLSFPNVALNDLAAYASYLDMARSTGSLSGQISITGPKSSLALQGFLTGTFDTLAANGIQTALKATVVDVKLKSDTILLTMAATGSDGGRLGADLTATVPDLAHALDQMAKGQTENLLAQVPVQGSATASTFNVRQTSKSKEYGTYHATVDAKISLSGKANKPLVTGRIGVTDTNVLLPSVFEGAGPSVAMLIDPQFNLNLALDEVAQFRTSTADLALTGGGALTGSLSRPDFNATLTLERGRIKLPTARITLEEGGTLHPTYSVGANGQTTERVDVNLEGRTAVTAMRLDTVQRYDIHLFITGDLLSDNGLNLNATSDPPDLTKDEILALLGQTDVLQTIGSSSGLSQSEAEARIRNALISVAVPSLTQGITSQIAQGLGLEYLGLEYNALEGTSVSFAKVWGKGLVLQGRRQISPPAGNRKVDYDLRLNYRIPTRNKALSRLVFSAGIDQDRPWKVGIEYGFRF